MLKIIDKTLCTQLTLKDADGRTITIELTTCPQEDSLIYGLKIDEKPQE